MGFIFIQKCHSNHYTKCLSAFCYNYHCYHTTHKLTFGDKFAVSALGAVACSTAITHEARWP